jgi:hypothetical protein
MSKDKKPNRTIDPLSNKQPSGKNKVDNIPNLCFKWKTNDADHDGDFGWNNIDVNKLFAYIIPKLQEFESMLWSDIEGHRNHFIPINDICKEAKDRLTVVGKEDEESLFSLSLSGKERIWGVRESNILKLLWWDPKHKVCPSNKKHT